MDTDPFLLELIAILLGERSANLARIASLEERIEREFPYLKEAAKADRNLRTLSGDSPAMKRVRQAIGQVAATDSTVLILGETGTGKELVARAIHQLSSRRDRLMVSVNCAALSPSVLPSELFGHEAGAFTGATKRRIGRFESAQQGTLFLDEIGEVSPENQVMLLRVLQERTLERVGGNQPIPIDVRVIAATHQDLAARVAAGTFRADLYYRLNVFPIAVPALRERPEDIADLARHVLRQAGHRMNRPFRDFDAATLARLRGYPWPGNVRELENIVERAAIAATGSNVDIDPNWLSTPSPEAEANGFRDVERRTIEEALRRARGRIYGPAGAAALLRLKPTTLYGKMRKLGIDRDGWAE